jgi:hypothetical protein
MQKLGSFGPHAGAFSGSQKDRGRFHIETSTKGELKKINTACE